MVSSRGVMSIDMQSCLEPPSLRMGMPLFEFELQCTATSCLKSWSLLKTGCIIVQGRLWQRVLILLTEVNKGVRWAALVPVLSTVSAQLVLQEG